MTVNLSKKTLKFLYNKKEMSTRDIASYLSIGQTTVRRYMDKYNIKARSSKESKNTDYYKNKMKDQWNDLTKTKTRECKSCGETIKFTPWEDKVFCDRKCYLKFKEKNKKPKKVMVKCGFCEEKFKTNRVNLKSDNNFCSKRCFGNYMSQINSRENSPCYNRAETKCGYCGKTLKLPQHRLKQEYNYCNDYCMGEHYKVRLKGEKSPCWKGGKVTYYGGNWERQKEKVRERDNFKCKLCGEYNDGVDKLNHSVHHIIPFDKFDNYEEANILNNLITLCNPCHMRIHNNPNEYQKFIKI